MFVHEHTGQFGKSAGRSILTLAGSCVCRRGERLGGQELTAYSWCVDLCESARAAGRTTRERLGSELVFVDAARNCAGYDGVHGQDRI